ncbi:hypothetical protein AAC387_Pa01g1322 [Persea americana]
MSAFDFGNLHERRKAERRAKLRKRLAIAGFLILFLIILAALGFVLYRSNHATHKKEEEEGENKKKASTSTKAIKMICAPTDYKNECESSLAKKVGKDSASHDAKDLLQAAIAVVSDEVKNGFQGTSKFKGDGDPKVKGAIEDCEELFGHAKDEINSTLDHIKGHGVHDLSHKSDDLQNWLSAVMSYQQTCIDGFPEGRVKSSMEEGMKSANKMTSNALAIIKQASSLFNITSKASTANSHPRRLLEEEDEEEVVEVEGEDNDDGSLPSWMSSHHHGTILKEQAKNKLKPNVVVAKDGSGNHKTINDALAAMPKKHTERYNIYIKGGIYEETVVVTKDMVNVTMYGDGSQKTVITGSKNFVDGVRTFKTATFAAIGDGFMAQAIGFRNTAGAAKHQAVALRVQSDRSVFVNCRMEGYQDTLYVQTHRQFYRGCVIAGTIDFIFGDAAAIFQSCLILLRNPLDKQQNTVTAQGRVDRHETTGFVLHNSRIEPDKLVPPAKQVKSYLGRPWKQYSRTIVMESTIGDLIHPDGWLPWDGDFALKTLVYGEFSNQGPGASVNARVKWSGYKVISKSEAMKYTVENFIQGGDWVKASGAPVRLALFH